MGLFGFDHLLIDESHAELLTHESNNIYIWCNADCYVREHGLKGFATGMFISEPTEAQIFGVPFGLGDITGSNTLFAQIVGNCLDRPSLEIYQTVLKDYFLERNHVCEFNRQRMFHFA